MRALFPLQGALGYDIAQTLFVGPNSLVVEGVSDLLYLQTMSGVLEESRREGLSDKWTITPVGGSDKVPTFAALLGAQKRMKVATLIDIQSKDRQVVENLYKRKLLQKTNVLTFADFTSTPEADIEDMFELDFYLRLVNGDYGKSLDKPIEESDLSERHPRVLVRLTRFLERSPLKGRARFSHYRPARYFVENVSDLTKAISPATLGRFETAFIRLNSLLA